MTKIGNIYLTKLERDFFGAFKILQIAQLPYDDHEVMMIAVLDIIDKQRITINDERLNDILRCKRFNWDNHYCINYFVTNPKYSKLKDYELIGNIPINEFEKEIPFELGTGRDGIHGGFGLAGVIENYFGNNAFLEWRWKNEREEFEHEIEESNKRSEEFRRNIVFKPKKMMDENQFWEIITLLSWNEADDDKTVEPAIKHLAKLKVSDIKQFEENLTYKLYCLDTKEHAKNIGDAAYRETDNYVSVDFFLYARCKAIANGQAFYEIVLKDPTKMPKDEEFEILLSVSETAYELKTKKELDYSTGCNYETYSNKTGWK